MSTIRNDVRIAILGGQETWHAQQLIAAFRRRGVVPEFVDPTRLRGTVGAVSSVQGEGIDLSAYDILLVRDVPGGSLEQVIFRMDALHQLENSGVRVINSAYAVEKMVDKYYTLSLLADAGLPVPESRVCEKAADARQAFDELGGDVVVKPLFGSRGIGMVRVAESDSAHRVFTALQLGGYIYYLQKFIPHDNRDMRVLVVGGECPAAMERIATDWKTNIAAGGKPTRIEVSPEIRDLCLIAAAVLGADYCGVDLLRDDSGACFLLEVNSIPAWQGLQSVNRIKIADMLVDYCFQQAGC